MTKKIIFLLNIDNYAPEITEITYPLIKKYAEKIGAEIIEITERKFPEMSPVYEKFQIYELCKQNPADWYLYIDSDCLVHPDLFDITEQIDKDTVFQNGSDFSPSRFKKNKHMIRDGRNIGTCNWFTVFSDLCVDLFNPDIGMSYEEILDHCFPTNAETFVFDRTHLVDDYILATNVARYGFKYKNFTDLPHKAQGEWFCHEYLIPKEMKVAKLAEAKRRWCDLSPEEARAEMIQKMREGNFNRG